MGVPRRWSGMDGRTEREAGAIAAGELGRAKRATVGHRSMRRRPLAVQDRLAAFKSTPAQIGQLPVRNGQEYPEYVPDPAKCQLTDFQLMVIVEKGYWVLWAPRLGP